MAATLNAPTPSSFRCLLAQRPKPTISCSQSFKFKRQYTSVMIVPTGIGASIGGYAGDALPVARALSSVVDCLITHPNKTESESFMTLPPPESMTLMTLLTLTPESGKTKTTFISRNKVIHRDLKVRSRSLTIPKVLNAAMLYWPMPNTLYVEGYALDRFAEGLWALQPVHQNRVGIVLDAGIEEDLRIRHLQVADAARASLGLPVVEYIVTDTPLEVEKWLDPETGQSTGRIKHPDSLLRAVQNLVSRSRVNAIAVVGRFPDDDTDDVDDYRQGKGVDLLAGIEAIISHLVVQEFRIPCAHAPALSPLPMSPSLSPKSAAEEIGYTFLPCVLAGLSNAPQYLVKNSESMEKGCILASDVDSVILPKDACGGDGNLAFARSKKNKPLLITVEENETVLNDTADKFGLEVLQVSNYWEAIGVVAGHKVGIDPFSLRRNKILSIGCTSLAHVNSHSISRQRVIS